MYCLHVRGDLEFESVESCVLNLNLAYYEEAPAAIDDHTEHQVSVATHLIKPQNTRPVHSQQKLEQHFFRSSPRLGLQAGPFFFGQHKSTGRDCVAGHSNHQSTYEQDIIQWSS